MKKKPDGKTFDFRRESLGEEVTCTIGERVFITGKIPQDQFSCKLDADKNVEITLYFRKSDIKKAEIKNSKKEPTKPPRKEITGDVFSAFLARRADFKNRHKESEDT
jgi:hypothetical protein